MAPKGPRPESQAKSRPQSREPSQDRGPQPQMSQEKPKRGRSRTRRSPSIASTMSDSGQEEVLPQGDSRRKRRQKKRQSTLPAVDEVEDVGREVANTGRGAVDTIGNTAGTVAGQGGGSDKPLKLRLDLNLDADIRLTAKIHGDVTLSLL